MIYSVFIYGKREIIDYAQLLRSIGSNTPDHRFLTSLVKALPQSYSNYDFGVRLDRSARFSQPLWRSRSHQHRSRRCITNRSRWITIWYILRADLFAGDVGQNGQHCGWNREDRSWYRQRGSLLLGLLAWSQGSTGSEGIYHFFSIIEGVRIDYGECYQEDVGVGIGDWSKPTVGLLSGSVPALTIKYQRLRETWLP